MNTKELMKHYSEIKRTLNDPIVKILLENSHLTLKMLETLLIDILLEDKYDEKIPYDVKARIRQIVGDSNRKGVSRGAFNRTLRQARLNIIKSMYTLLLIGYLGLLDGPIFQPYISLSQNIRNFIETQDEVWSRYLEGKATEEDLVIIQTLQQNIVGLLQNLSHPLSLSNK